MRWCARRTLIGAAVVLAGIVIGSSAFTQGAGPVPESELKPLFDQDAKNIPLMVEMGKKGGAANSSKAARSIKSNAVMIAYYANTRITGKGGADEGKMIALRDAAIKVALSGGKKKFADAGSLAKQLSLDMPGAGNGKPMTLEELKKASELDLEELMYQFKKTGVGGLGIEEDVKAQAKKVTMTPDQVAVLAARVNAVAEWCEVMEVQGGFSTKKPKKDWEVFNKDMLKAVGELQTAAKSKDNKKIQTAFDKLDRSCTACHEKMK
jgi:hypothetical protein